MRTVATRSRCRTATSLTGPIVVEGAEPGDALAVTIHEIRPTIGACATRTADPKQLCEWLGTDCPHGTYVCPIRDGLIYWSDSVTIPYSRCWAVSALPLDWGCPTTAPAGPHGGNMDIIETCPGSTVYSPVFVPGASPLPGRCPCRDGPRRTLRHRPGDASPRPRSPSNFTRENG